MNAGHVRRLYEYNAWANRRILERAAEASEDAYLAEFPGLSFGSLHGTLVHLFDGQLIWLRRWQAAGLDGLGPWTIEALPDFEAVAAAAPRLEAALEAHVAALTDADIEGTLTYEAPNGQTYTDPRSLQLVHLVNHGTQFRAEAAVRLTALGLSPGNIDFTVLLRGLT
ncbi:MAG: DinB family protein [Dehalococcoidia bacterium]